MIKKITYLLLTIVLLLSFSIRAEEVIKVGATPMPHAEILNYIKPFLAEEGIKLKVVEFTDYVTPNLALADGSIDANYFQHLPYLNQFKKDRNLKLTSLAQVHVEPYGLYSKKINSIEELSKGDAIAIPNDPSNEARALLLLHNKGIIKLNSVNNLKATPLDIVENPLKLKFKELEAAQLPRVLLDVTAAFINTNYALEAGLNPLKDALIIEGKESPYANIIAVRNEDKNNSALQKLVAILCSEKVRTYINKEYRGAIVPAF